jgi:hypothetical protein
MIIRKEANGLTLIPQTEHSQFVGQLAAHWGNKQFAPLEPYESVVRGATYHDYGYLNWEPDLPFDAEHGEPLEFRKIPTAERQLNSYQWCIDWLTGIDPYSGLLVNMHRTGLWRGRYGTIEYPTAFNPRSLSSEVEAFIERNEARQKKEQAQQPHDQLWGNFHLLQVWDLLGLYFGCQEPVEDHVDPVPLGYGKDKVSMSMKPLGGNKVLFDPYPFDQDPLRVQIACKRLPQATYPDEASFRKAYFQAPNELLEYQLMSG